MKPTYFICFSFWVLAHAFSAKCQSRFEVSFDTMRITGLPGLHSFAVATHEGKWLIMGGRLDGMHQKFNGFTTNLANQKIYVVEPEQKRVWQRSISELPDTLQEQLRSTNMEFFQSGDRLYFAGGYGRSETAQNHITYPYLTVVDVPKLVETVKDAKGPLMPCFQQIRDTFFAVTGGQMYEMSDTLYLVGGHRFDGVYSANSANPTQFYTNAIRKFCTTTNDIGLLITHKSAWVDELNLHRRDYNLSPAILSNGKPGLVAYSGVFQPGVMLTPFFNIVEISPEGHQAINGFKQLLTNYHCARVPIWAESVQESHTLFFGGISSYWLNENDSLMKDNRLPFVRTVSRVTRRADAAYEEAALPVSLPFYTGTGAEFVLSPTLPTLANGMVDYDKLPFGTVLLGYIVGGIVTPETQRNPFVANTLGITSASPRIIKVYLEKKTESSASHALNSRFDLNIKIAPNPATTQWNIGLSAPVSGRLRAMLQNAEGRLIRHLDLGEQTQGECRFVLPGSDLRPGAYWLTLNLDGVYMETKPLAKQEE